MPAVSSKLTLVAAVLVCVVTSGESVSGRFFCAGPFPPCQAAWRHPVVFLGQLVHIEDGGRGVNPELAGLGMRRRMTFRVIEGFRGDLGETADVYDVGGEAPTTFTYQPTRSYLVYANRRPGGGQLITGACFRTRPGEQAAEDLAYLRGPARQPAVLGTVQGVAVLRTPQTPHAAFDQWTPYVGGRVTIESMGEGPTVRFSALTDAEGRFAVRAPVGKYRASLRVAEGFSTSSTGVETELIDARGCVEIGFVVRPSAADRSAHPRR